MNDAIVHVMQAHEERDDVLDWLEPGAAGIIAIEIYTPPRIEYHAPRHERLTIRTRHVALECTAIRVVA